jgi:hypothetical protein
MKTGAWLVVCLLALLPAVSAGADTPSPANSALFRVFLTDGTSLVSYGEVTTVGDRVIFSMPVGPATAASSDPFLQLVNIPSDRVDWSHTNSYAESARATNYFSTRAQDDYVQLTNEVAKALNAVSFATDPSTRVTVIENARKMLADWPSTHYYYNQADVLQLIAYLDEVIAGFQASRGGGRFNLSLVSNVAAQPVREALLPPPTLKEAIEQMLIAAGLAESPMERSSLLANALSVVRGSSSSLPAEWARSTELAVRARIAEEVQIERNYQLLTQQMSRAASDLARAADVRGIERLLAQIHVRDEMLGSQRPDMVLSLNQTVQEQLTAARRLQLERDQWNLRLAALRRYNTALAPTFERFALLKGALEDIQALAGSTPTTFMTIDRLTGEITRSISQITPPAELEAAHALLVSAAQLADSAGRIRREAAEHANVDRAWDASSAAAGSLMLTARARSEIQMRLRMPQLPQ